MTKADIIERIHTKLGFSRKDSAELTETIFTILKETLESGEDAKISGFGKFEVKQKKDRRGRNPQTGESITNRHHSQLLIQQYLSQTNRIL